MRVVLGILLLSLLLGSAPAEALAERPDWRGSRHAVPEDYAWLDPMTPSDTYTISVVRGASKAAVLRTLGGVRRDLGERTPGEAEEFLFDHMDPRIYTAPPVAQVERRGRAVVVYAPYGVFAGQTTARLSRHRIAVEFVTTVEYDTYVTVGKKGRVVRQFDAGFRPPVTGALPAEDGLDWGERDQNIWATAWAFMERLTRTHLSREWFAGAHRTYVLKRRGALL